LVGVCCPQPNRAVVAGGGEGVSVAAEGDRVDGVRVAREGVISGLSADRKPIGESLANIGDLTDATSGLRADARPPLNNLGCHGGYASWGSYIKNWHLPIRDLIFRVCVDDRGSDTCKVAY
jgi:hypothetical protein